MNVFESTVSESEAVTVGTTMFQTNCISDVRRILQASGYSIEFIKKSMKENPRLQQSQGDVYMVGSLRAGSDVFEIYIYPDEAGFFKNKIWHIWEEVDFSTPAELQTSFVDGLKAELKKSLKTSFKDP